jgi:hypothetical protein
MGAGMIAEASGRIRDPIAGVYFNRQGAPVESAFERLNFQRHAVVVNAVSTMDSERFAATPPIESAARTEIRRGAWAYQHIYWAKFQAV